MVGTLQRISAHGGSLPHRNLGAGICLQGAFHFPFTHKDWSVWQSNKTIAVRSSSHSFAAVDVSSVAFVICVTIIIKSTAARYSLRRFAPEEPDRQSPFGDARPVLTLSSLSPPSHYHQSPLDPRLQCLGDCFTLCLLLPTSKSVVGANSRRRPSPISSRRKYHGSNDCAPLHHLLLIYLPPPQSVPIVFLAASLIPCSIRFSLLGAGHQIRILFPCARHIYSFT